jgi:hypothetical protein
MKKITSLLTLGLLLVLSCEKEGPTTVNEITDLYTAPADAKVMTLTGANSTWSTDRRYFDLNFSELSTTLVGYDALLAPGQYVIGGDQIGSAINTKVNGQNAGDGFFTVNSKDGQYAITATINGQVYYWTGALPFEADPAPTALTVVLSAQSNLANGVNSLTMSLATEGISQEMDWTTWQQTWVGEGGYLALDIYSDDGYLHEGTYKASAEGGVINAGEFGIGYDTVIEYTDWNTGQPASYEAKDWGTCWWDVKDGAATATKITDGLVNVTGREEKVDGKDVTIWTITWGAEYPVELLFEGAIPALTKPKKPDGPVVPNYLYTEVVTPGDTYDTHAISITDKDGNEVAYLELLTDPGAAELTGSYPATSYAGSPGQMRDGYNFPDWGISGGSYYVEGGEKQYIGAGTATVDVTKIATGAYTFSCAFFSYDAAGPDYVPGEGGEDVGDAIPAKDVVTEHAAGVDKHTVTIGQGDDIVAVFELLTAAGDDFVGTFVSTEYASEPGMLCNGYSFPDWNIFGGSYIMVDGARQDVAPGETVEVTKVSGNVYKFVGSAGFTYVADVAK